VILLFFPAAPVAIVLLTLAIALYLTVVELREMEPRPHFTWWIWWLLLVFMTHFVGYLALRVYAFLRRRRTADA
jgi:hypothetical protein